MESMLETALVRCREAKAAAMNKRLKHDMRSSVSRVELYAKLSGPEAAGASSFAHMSEVVAARVVAQKAAATWTKNAESQREARLEAAIAEAADELGEGLRGDDAAQAVQRLQNMTAANAVLEQKLFQRETALKRTRQECKKLNRGNAEMGEAVMRGVYEESYGGR